MQVTRREHICDKKTVRLFGLQRQFEDSLEEADSTLLYLPLTAAVDYHNHASNQWDEDGLVRCFFTQAPWGGGADLG
jgi:hypothetical protein